MRMHNVDQISKPSFVCLIHVNLLWTLLLTRFLFFPPLPPKIKPAAGSTFLMFHCFPLKALGCTRHRIYQANSGHTHMHTSHPIRSHHKGVQAPSIWLQSKAFHLLACKHEVSSSVRSHNGGRWVSWRGTPLMTRPMRWGRWVCALWTLS